MMGAMYTNSFFNRLWNKKIERRERGPWHTETKRDFFLEPHKSIQQKVTQRLSKHSNGHLLTIKYFCERRWTKNYRDSPGGVIGSDIPKMDFIVQKTMEEFGDEEYLWVGNKEFETLEKRSRIYTAYFDQPNATRLSGDPYGLNKLDHIHNLVFTSALNLTPAHNRFLKSRGMTDEDIRNALFHQKIYQSVMRLSLRDRDSPTPPPVTVIVPDRKAAEWLAQWFEGCSVERIDGLDQTPQKKPGPKPKGKSAKNATVRKREQRERERERLATPKG